MTITDAINTYNLAIEIIYSKKYELFTQKKDEDYILYVKKNDFMECAEEPLSLLSIVYMRDHGITINKYRTDLLQNSYSSTAIDIILEKNYKIELTKEYSSEWYDWVARRKDTMVIAQSPLKLLGLILILEVYGNDWYSVEIPFYLNSLEER